DDDTLFRTLALLDATEGLRAEPSAMAGVVGPVRIGRHVEELRRLGITPEQYAASTHIAWLTGGSMVPEAEMSAYIERGRGLEARCSSSTVGDRDFAATSADAVASFEVGRIIARP